VHATRETKSRTNRLSSRNFECTPTMLRTLRCSPSNPKSLAADILARSYNFEGPRVRGVGRAPAMTDTTSAWYGNERRWRVKPASGQKCRRRYARNLVIIATSTVGRSMLHQILISANFCIAITTARPPRSTISSVTGGSNPFRKKSSVRH
jgi:hypothetical protein